MKTYSVRRSVDTMSSASGRESLLSDKSLLDQLLFYRGIRTPAEIEQFLNPSYDRHTHDPFLLKDMDKAVTRILKAIRGGDGNNGEENGGEKTVIYSDYDTDGIPGAVALHDFFKKIGFKNFTNYIPHRHDEGFGLNSDAVAEFAEGGVKLLITIDCGIADVGPVTEARKAGIDVIITDHHLPPQRDTLPPAFAIINPKQADCTYPEKMLCGAGVVYKLIQALIKKGSFSLKDGWEKWLLDMVGIATLSDMVPLTGENRVFAYYGLMVLRKSPRAGLMRLLSELGVDQRYLTEDDIGFTIGPRINAASRMGVPMDAFHLLSTDDPVLAGQYAKHLNAINDERKGTVAALVKEIKKTIKERWGNDAGSDGEMPAVIVLGNPNWRPSLVGLAANTVAEEYGRPVYLWGRDGDNIIKGSCRSDGETDLVALMQVVATEEMSAKAKTFIQFGGHAMSGGFAVADDTIHTLSDKLNAAFEKLKKAEAETNEEIGTAEKAGVADKKVGSIGKTTREPIFIDKEMSLADVTWDTYSMIEKLAPFGVGNPKPLFMFKNVRPSSVRQFGKVKNHLEVIFNNPSVKAIAFFKTVSDWTETLGRNIEVGMPITLIATFEKSIFRGKTELRLRIADIIK